MGVILKDYGMVVIEVFLYVVIRDSFMRGKYLIEL